MFDQKVMIGALITAVLNFGISFVWYDILMSDFFPTVEGVTRDPVNFPIIILGVLIFSYAFASLFRMAQNGVEPLMSQAIRFGVLVAMMSSVAYLLFNFASLNIWNSTQIMADIAFNIILTIILAISLSKYYGPVPVMATRDSSGLKPKKPRKGPE